MKYNHTITATFQDRPNRFIAHVWVDGVRPYGIMHKEFEVAFEEAKAAGVEVIFLCCKVEEDSLVVV